MIIYTRKAYPQDNNLNTFHDYHSLERVLDCDTGASFFQLVGKHPVTGLQIVKKLDVWQRDAALERFFLQ